MYGDFFDRDPRVRSGRTPDFSRLFMMWSIHPQRRGSDAAQPLAGLEAVGLIDLDDGLDGED